MRTVIVPCARATLWSDPCYGAGNLPSAFSRILLGEVRCFFWFPMPPQTLLDSFPPTHISSRFGPCSAAPPRMGGAPLVIDSPAPASLAIGLPAPQARVLPDLAAPNYPTRRALIGTIYPGVCTFCSSSFFFKSAQCAFEMQTSFDVTDMGFEVLFSTWSVPWNYASVVGELVDGGDGKQDWNFEMMPAVEQGKALVSVKFERCVEWLSWAVKQARSKVCEPGILNSISIKNVGVYKCLNRFKKYRV